MNHVIEFPLPGLLATRRLAAQIALGLQTVLGRSPFTIALSGPLGSGKTQWIRYLCEELGVPPESVTSPTYVLLQRYRAGGSEIYHLDYYRLQQATQVWDLGVDELQEQPVLILVEWADQFPETLAADHLHLEFFQSSESQCSDTNFMRNVRITGLGPIATNLVALYLQPLCRA